MTAPPAMPPSPPAPTKAQARRAPASPERRALLVGLAGTVLVHLLLIFLLPRLPLSGPAGPPFATNADGSVFEVQIEPPAPAEPAPRPEPPRFVEANPAAPDNVPDKTNNFAAQNQQVAQPKPTPDGRNHAPASEGDPTRPSDAIVSGNNAESHPLPVAPASPPAATTPQTEPARKPQTPLPGTEEARGVSPDTPGTSVAAAGPNPAPVTERVEGNPTAAADNRFTIGLPVQVDPLHPRPRPTITAANTSKARTAPLLNNPDGTENNGPLSYDAHWSAYGEYLDRLINAVQAQWWRIVDQSSVYPERGTKVQVVFRLDSRGEIAEIVSVTGNGNRDAQTACVSAITGCSPYGAWSADMIAQLGESQKLTFNFYYD